MTDDQRLDPDEVWCPRCHEGPGTVCRTPGGARSRSVHLERRRRAADGVRGPLDPAQPATAPQRPTRKGGKPAGSSTFTSETAAAAAKRAAQERRRRRNEADAALEAAREKAQREAVEAEAQQLADDAVQWQKDRALVRRQILDAAAGTASRLNEAVAGLRRPRGFDDHGQPLTVTVEQYEVKNGRKIRVFDEDGNPVNEEQVDVIGWYSVDHVVNLSKALTSAHNALRLEEGKATEIHGDTGTHPADVLGEAGTAELLAAANRLLPKTDQS